MQKLKLFRTQNPQVETGAPPRVFSGNPQTRSWNHTSDLNDRLFTGIWEATPGSWAVSYDEWEFCHIISGRAIIRDPLGNEIEVSAGDAFVIEPGFEGTWSVSETIAKHYVILMPK
jgi:uncharacterized protein